MKTALTISTLCVALCLPQATMAGPDRLSILLGSEHVGANRDFQEFNPGVILTWERNFNYSLGVYYNSYKNISALGAVGYDIEVAPDFDIGAFAGMALYPGDGDQFSYSLGDLVPLVGLQARYKNVFVQYLPGGGDSIDALLTFGLTFALD